VRNEELARLHLSEPVDLQALKAEWLAALGAVPEFVESRPPGEIGCLYYSASRQGFVDPRDVDDARPHYGRPGGVLPTVG
jgi:hypothetical protein